MTYIPQPIATDIVRRVGHSGFGFLRPFIAAVPFWHATTLSPEVFFDVDIDEFVFNSRLGNPHASFTRHA
ncbi:hypothetical protein AT2G06565 [Arabidopsis thaliana]|uniref:Uncharacterized protein n=2 Tax=Arabidopsis thaliana TaxID=3702 RepID=A0A5S9WXH6_ARATH|nr:uncharacterized protein AT2G06565 [Arabidopsis thaliana]ANM61233.1 hypothetical protein AT2G06565 [Arabidopsis thaliana]CAA0359164.1 unnamed protein product [Arabidopsis thaliana]|eukprot:NP_001323463.1 hypothetical protein AT2G06565 [Arabidopsis thaliana]